MKNINDRHVIGERGVIQFHNYCNRHTPYIMFRELVQNDFGIDGEVEIAKVDENGKRFATGEILKVQIKSTESDNSYIRSETENSFKYYASRQDIEYWSNITGDVILIIYDGRNDTLYAKKIPNFNLKESKKIESFPIDFDKKDNLLKIQDNSFVESFTASFYTRVNYDSKDILGSNMCRVFTSPALLYEYDTYFATKKSVFEVVDGDDCPFFTLNGKRVFTFYEISKDKFPEFHSKVISNSKPKKWKLNDIRINQNLRNQYSENLNLIIRSVLRKRGIRYHKKYRRFYFIKFDEDTRTVDYKTRVYQKVKERDVVSHHVYGQDEFYRHIAFSFQYVYCGDELYLVVNPKYLFTLDGRETLEPKKITKYTNYKTQREFNNAVINQIHFVIDYLCNGGSYWKVFEYGKLKLYIARPTEFTTDFSIAGRENPKANSAGLSDEILLFNEG